MPIINLFHALAVAPAIAYIGYQNYKGKVLPQNIAMTVMIVAAIVFLFHSFLAVRKHLGFDQEESTQVPMGTQLVARNPEEESKVAPTAAPTPTGDSGATAGQ